MPNFSNGEDDDGPPGIRRKVTAVILVETYTDEGRLVQVFEYVDGPKKGERVKLVSKLLP